MTTGDDFIDASAGNDRPSRRGSGARRLLTSVTRSWARLGLAASGVFVVALLVGVAVGTPGGDAPATLPGSATGPAPCTPIVAPEPPAPAGTLERPVAVQGPVAAPTVSSGAEESPGGSTSAGGQQGSTVSTPAAGASSSGGTDDEPQVAAAPGRGADRAGEGSDKGAEKTRGSSNGKSAGKGAERSGKSG